MGMRRMERGGASLSDSACPCQWCTVHPRRGSAGMLVSAQVWNGRFEHDSSRTIERMTWSPAIAPDGSRVLIALVRAPG
jgi:hypothetical protein